MYATKKIKKIKSVGKVRVKSGLGRCSNAEKILINPRYCATRIPPHFSASFVLLFLPVYQGAYEQCTVKEMGATKSKTCTYQQQTFSKDLYFLNIQAVVLNSALNLTS